MSARIRNASLASCLGLAAACAGAGDVWASGFALREESAEGLGDAYAGQAAKAYNASTVFYNPAGMIHFDANEVAATATWIAPEARFSGANSSPLGGNVAGSTEQNGIKAAAIGSLFSTWNASPDWKFGLSVAVPFGMRVDYKPGWVGRYQALASDVTDIELSMLAAYRVDDHLSIGGGPRADYMKVRLSQAINFNALGAQTAQAYQAQSAAAIGAGQPALAQQLAAAAQTTSQWGDGLGKTEGDDYGLGYTLGLLYEFNPETRAGLNYRSRVYHTISGQASFQTPSTIALAGPAASAFANQNASAKVVLPDSLNLGIYHDIDSQWAVMASVEWTDWSVFRQLNVVGANGQLISSTNENWQNTWFFSLGANYKPDDRWTLHGGVAFDQSPVRTPDRTARIPDSNRYWLSGGVSYAVTRSTDVHLGYTHIFADKASIDETANQLAGVLMGTYKNSVDIVSTSVAMRF